MSKSKHWRQGDVLVIEAKTPETSEPVEREGGRVVLAHGELTGHAHAISEPHVTMRKTPEGRFFLEVTDAPAALRHEEHDAIKLGAGKYRAVRQTEYTPQALRNVAD